MTLKSGKLSRGPLRHVKYDFHGINARTNVRRTCADVTGLIDVIQSSQTSITGTLSTKKSLGKLYLLTSGFLITIRRPTRVRVKFLEQPTRPSTSATSLVLELSFHFAAFHQKQT